MTVPESKGKSFFITLFFAAVGDRLQLTQYSDPVSRAIQATIPRGMELSRIELEDHLKNGSLIIDLRDETSIPPTLLAYPKQLGCITAAYVPILQEGQLCGIVLIGAREGQIINDDVINAFDRTIHLAANFIAPKAPKTEPADDRRTSELKALNTLASNVTSIDNLQSFYSTVHDHIRNVVGDYGIVIALYDQNTNSINIPYLYEDGKISTIEAFPLGEGLTSILIRTREPLMLVEDTMNRATAMGAKLAGKPAKSWLGVPLVAHGEPIGAIIVQDVDNEHSFNEDDLRFLTSIAGQVSGALYNIRVLDKSRQVALQFETAAEIARDISSSLDLDDLLKKAVELIRTRFSFYHAGVFLKDTAGEYVVIREATGEAGAQMNRSGHKLGVGSKSSWGLSRVMESNWL